MANPGRGSEMDEIWTIEVERLARVVGMEDDYD
jgi:hypothetical protein